jgi:hypothetical protein
MPENAPAASNEMVINAISQKIHPDLEKLLEEFVILGIRNKTPEEIERENNKGNRDPAEGDQTVFFYVHCLTPQDGLALINGSFEKLLKILQTDGKLTTQTSSGEWTEQQIQEMLYPLPLGEERDQPTEN